MNTNSNNHALLKKCTKLSFIVLWCVMITYWSSAGAKPTITFTMPPSLQSIPSISTFTQQLVERKQVEQMKSYSGLRRRADSLIMIYYHDQLIAITELGPAKLLLGCELIEIYNDSEGSKLLRNLSALNRPLEIKFNEMLKLMNQCEIVDKQNRELENKSNNVIRDEEPMRGMLPRSPLSLLSGIIPGTKWCGTGDIAASYHDLGTEMTMDRCCREHDLCPVKIRAYQTRYNLSNKSIYTKSHCICDDMLYSCLKKTNTSAAQVMGSIYFNVVQVPCIHETSNRTGLQYRRARDGF